MLNEDVFGGAMLNDEYGLLCDCDCIWGWDGACGVREGKEDKVLVALDDVLPQLFVIEDEVLALLQSMPAGCGV
jgi:hypothetical protein